MVKADCLREGWKTTANQDPILRSQKKKKTITVWLDAQRIEREGKIGLKEINHAEDGCFELKDENIRAYLQTLTQCEERPFLEEKAESNMWSDALPTSYIFLLSS